MSTPPPNTATETAAAPNTTVNPVAKVGTTTPSSATVVQPAPGFRQYFLKWLGSESSPGFSLPVNAKSTILPIIAFFCALFIALIIEGYAKDHVLGGGLVLSLFMIFFFPKEQTSQPRNIFLGHVLGALIGLIFNEIIRMAPKCYKTMCYVLHQSISVGVTAFLMMLFPDFQHMPALVTAARAASNMSDRWTYLWTPTIAGTLLVIALGLIFNNLITRYPRYW